MGSPGRVFFVCAAVMVLQGCLVTEGIGNYTKVSRKSAESIADNAYCLSQAAYSVIAAITPSDDVCQQYVDVPPDKSAAGLTKSQVVEYIVSDYKTLTELIMAGHQYCYYIYLNRTYQCDRNSNCLGICERLLNQSRTVAAETRRIILGLGCGSSSAPPECDGFSFLPPFEVNSTVYSTITNTHSLARSIMSVACNLEESIIGYRIARLKGVPVRGGASVDKICVRVSNTKNCPKCDDHLNKQCKL